ncbi:hypothetical protein Q3G72_013394 [Acer saccharum]|nr:hypothetical protein Q3G72_013394 [Acer saccharum]
MALVAVRALCSWRGLCLRLNAIDSPKKKFKAQPVRFRIGAIMQIVPGLGGVCRALASGRLLWRLGHMQRHEPMSNATCRNPCWSSTGAVRPSENDRNSMCCAQDIARAVIALGARRRNASGQRCDLRSSNTSGRLAALAQALRPLSPPSRKRFLCLLRNR